MNRGPRHLSILIVCCLAGLAACAPTLLEEQPAVAPPLPDRSAPGAERYEVVPADTLVYARVFRGGKLEALGHNHVVVFKDVTGYLSLAPSPGASLFDLAVSVARVDVDPAELRQRQEEEGFDTRVSDQARSGTRANMLSEDILNAAAYPYVMIGSTSIEGSFDAPRVTVTADITIKEVTRQVTLPVTLKHDGDRLVASGRFELLQTDFGIEPFSALGGALKVEDRVELVFSVAAERVES